MSAAAGRINEIVTELNLFSTFFILTQINVQSFEFRVVEITSTYTICLIEQSVKNFKFSRKIN